MSARQRQRLKTFLVQKVRTHVIPIQIRCWHQFQVRLVELVLRLERLLKHRARQQIPHLQPHQRLPTPRRRRTNVRIQTSIRRTLKLKHRLTLHMNCFNHSGHNVLFLLQRQAANNAANPRPILQSSIKGKQNRIPQAATSLPTTPQARYKPLPASIHTLVESPPTPSSSKPPASTPPTTTAISSSTRSAS